MPIQADWMNEEKTILVQRISDEWTWGEYLNVNVQKIPVLMNETEEDVTIVADFRNGANLPTGSAITHMKNALEMYPENWRYFVILAVDHFIPTLAELFRQMYPEFEGKILAVQTEDEIVELLSHEVGEVASVEVVDKSQRIIVVPEIKERIAS